jgi:hypothetical protein
MTSSQRNTYDEGHPNIYKTKYDVPSLDIVQCNGELYDTQNNNQYRRID